MGKKITGTRVQRIDKVAFMNVGTTEAPDYVRMQGFTSLPPTKSPLTYERQYIDEKGPRTDTVGMSETIEYAFDYYKGNEVHDKIVAITDEEKIGDDAIVEIMVVDIKEGTAKMRQYTVQPGSEGDSTESYTYSGTFTSYGDIVKGTATSTDEFMTATFAATGTGI